MTNFKGITLKCSKLKTSQAQLTEQQPKRKTCVLLRLPSLTLAIATLS